MDLLAIFAVLISFFIKGLAGFANTLIFGAIMNFSAANLQITPLSTLLSTPSNLIIVWKERKNVSVKTFLYLTAMVMAGSIPGTFFLKSADTGLLKSLFGVLIIIVGVEMLLRERARKKSGSKLLMTVIGLVSGICCGMFGVGALLAAYVSRTSDDPGQFRGTLCAVFAAENCFRLVLYACTGILTGDILMQAAVLLPFEFVGLAAGIFCSGKLKERTVKRAVIVLLIISGIALIFNA